jgi:hypothetical protein
MSEGEQTVLFESSNIKLASYNPESETLSISFKNGSTYDYLNVPFDVFKGLIKADSAGKYFYQHIRDEFVFRKEEKKDETESTES